MRNTGWKIISLIMIISLSGIPAFAKGLGGWVNMVRSTSDSYEEGEKISSTESFNRNVYLRFGKSITPLISYQLNVRANLQDSDVTDSDGFTTGTSRRRLEPALDLSLRNSMYDLNFGFRRQEEWAASELKDEDRETSVFYYSRFNLSPKDLPSLSMHIDSQKEYDYLSVRETDRTNNSYSISSAYELPSRDLRLRYNFNFSHNVQKTPLSTAEKSINDSFNSNYNLGYYRDFWGKKGLYTINYRGNYAKNKNQQFLTETGSFVNERSVLGFYGKGTAANQEVDELESNGSLVNDFTTATSFNLGNEDIINNRYHNLGMLVSFQKSVDRIYIYVNKDVRGDNNLTNISNWKVHKSSSNQVGLWENISLDIQSIIPTQVDGFINIYRYELVFKTSHEDSFFRVINMETADIPNVAITKIEAWGTDDVDELHTTDISTSFTQGLDFSSNVRLMPKLSLAFNYSINRADQNPVSVNDSMLGVLENVFSDSIPDDKEDFRSNVTRNYGFTTTWLTHELLTTTLRLQRNENFDNQDETDSHSNSYHLSFNSVPMPTLDTTLSLIRSDRYNFNEKDSTNHSVLLSVGSQLYRDVNMITDLGYTNSQSFANDTESSSYTLNGSLDALITRKMSGTLNYSYSRTVSEGDTSIAKEATSSINYQPGRFINLAGNFRISNSDGEVTVSEGLLADWLALPVVRLNLSYQHTDSDSGPSISDSFSSYGIWYLTKFADLRFSYTYSQNQEETRTESHNFSTNLNCRF